MNYYISSHVERSLKVLAKHFEGVMEDQQVFEHEKCVNLMLKIIATRSEKLRDRVRERWNRCKGAPVRQMFTEMIEEITKF